MAKRTQEEVREAMAKVDDLIAGGATQEGALAKVGVARSVFGRWKKKKPGVERGRVDVSAFPPRPKKKGKHGGKRVRGAGNGLDRNSVVSVAKRIERLNRKLAELDALKREHGDLAELMQKLLNRWKDPLPLFGTPAKGRKA